MGDLFWQTDEQLERLQTFFSKSHGRSQLCDHSVLGAIIFINRTKRSCEKKAFV